MISRRLTDIYKKRTILDNPLYNASSFRISKNITFVNLSAILIGQSGELHDFEILDIAAKPTRTNETFG
jgi:hypothetical protein